MKPASSLIFTKHFCEIQNKNTLIKENTKNIRCERHSLALLVQQVEQRGGFLADEVDAGRVVHVVDHVPADALRAILLLTDQTHTAN